MGQCKYCDEDAGFFSHVHKECEENILDKPGANVMLLFGLCKKNLQQE